MVNLPLEWVTFGTTVTTPNELCFDKDLRMFSIQGHPEYSNEWAALKYSSLLSYYKFTDAPPEEAFKVMRVKYSTKNDQLILVEWCNRFLRC